MPTNFLDRTASPTVEDDTMLRRFSPTLATGSTGEKYSTRSDGVTIVVISALSSPGPVERTRNHRALENYRLHTDWRQHVDPSASLFPGEQEEMLWKGRNDYPIVDSPNVYALDESQAPLPAPSPLHRGWIPNEPEPSIGADDLQRAVDHIRQMTQKHPEFIAELRRKVQEILDLDEFASPSWLEDLQRLKEIAKLSDAEVGTLLGVTRSSVQGWWNRSQRMRPDRQQHLQAVLSVMEDALSRANRNRENLRYALFGEVSGRADRPFDYLKERKYRIGRGFLISAVSPKNVLGARRRFLDAYPVPLSLEDRDAVLEDLSPTPRID